MSGRRATPASSEPAVRCAKLRTELGYSDEDARSVALSNIGSIASSTQMVLNLLDSWTIGNPQVKQAIPQLLGIQDATERSAKTAEHRLHKTSKLGLALLGQFQIENCLKCLAREFVLPEVNEGFYLLARALLKKLLLPSDQLDILNVPALIRNSLHANGIHRGHGGRDSLITIYGVTYEFRDGKAVSCASV